MNSSHEADSIHARRPLGCMGSARASLAALLVAALAGCAGSGNDQTEAPIGAAGTLGMAGSGGAGVAGIGVAGSGGAGTGVAGTGGAGNGVAGSGVAGSGAAGTGDGAGGTAGSAGNATFVDLAPPLGEPFDPAGATALTPAAPADWSWYPIDGASCRDGSPFGVMVRHTDSDKLLIYFEGGGACTSAGFCNFNPPSVDHALSGDGQSVLGSTFGSVLARQQPGVFEGGAIAGIFDRSKTENPFQNWNMIYIPYCTGDVHFGSNPSALPPGMTTPQKFVGYLNAQKVIGRAVPTFADRVDRVVVTGASAGSFGAALNYSMIQDAFGQVRVDAVLDSGAPFADEYWPPCLQQFWRELFKLNDSLPPDCDECFAADGGGLLGMADFLIRKHPGRNIAVISSMHDEVIRLFFTPGEMNCATIETADPVAITTGQILGGMLYPAADYEAALLDLRQRYLSSNRLATYYLGGPNILLHQHTFRARFYDPSAGSKTIAAFVTSFLNDTMEQVGP